MKINFLNIIYTVVGYGIFKYVEDWSKPQMDPRMNNEVFLPRELCHPFIDKRVQEVYQYFRKYKHPCINNFSSLSRWRFFCPDALDTIFISFYEMFQTYNKVQIAKQNSHYNMSQSIYDEFVNHYNKISLALNEYKKVVMETHEEYCKSVARKELLRDESNDPKESHENSNFTSETHNTINKSNQTNQTDQTDQTNQTNQTKDKKINQNTRSISKELDIVQKRREVINRLDYDIKSISYRVSKIKNDVDTWFLTAKYIYLYERQN